jgi:RNA polymerase sigma factor (sigma-70 family)
MADSVMFCKEPQQHCQMGSSVFEVYSNGDLDDPQKVTAFVRCCLCGSEAAWNLMYRLFSGYTGAIAMQKGFFQRADADDLVQETFLRLHVRLLRFDPRRGALLNFIKLVTRNVCAEEWRRRRSMLRKDTSYYETKLSTAPSGADEPLVQKLEERFSGLVTQALEALKQRCREILRLRFCQHLSYTEIAGVLDNEPTPISDRHLERLRQQAHRCVEDLREEFARLEELGIESK